MFGVRIWLTPMHSTSSSAASLRLARFSPTLFGMAPTLPPTTFTDPALSRRLPDATGASLPAQVNGEPDSGRPGPRLTFQLVKAASAIKSDGAPIGGADREVRAARAHVPYRCQ